MPSVNCLCCGEAPAGSTLAFTLYMHNCHYAIHPRDQLFSVAHPDLQIRASVWSKNKGGGRAPRAPPLYPPMLLSHSRSRAHVRGERQRREECGRSPREGIEKMILFPLSTPISPSNYNLHNYTFSLGRAWLWGKKDDHSGSTCYAWWHPRDHL